MAHYAFVNNANFVVEVITGRDEDDATEGVTDWEAYYSNERPGLRALRTSYNTVGGEHLTGGTPFRGNYAGIGYTYDTALNAFIPPQPYPSWTLNTTTFQWVAPVPMPEEGFWQWDEEAGDWVEVEAS